MVEWEKITHHRAPRNAPAPWTHAELREWIGSYATREESGVRWEVVGRSVEGREVWMATLGDGPRSVLAWSQMHGDEPTHTGALCRLIDYLVTSPQDAAARSILAGCTLHLVPMLNPDGAERGTRFNAQGIDVNRDARRLATPEGRVLNRLVRELSPHFGFNLHNQNHRTRVADRPAPAAMALLVPPRDPQNSKTASVDSAARVAAAIRDAAAPHCDELVTRYDADYMPRAFGEWVQSQGVATVLIEAGWRSDGDCGALEDLHLFALAVALEAIATGAYRSADPQAYESLLRPAEHRLPPPPADDHRPQEEGGPDA